MASGDDAKKTLGGVAKQTFRPNLAVARNKKQTNSNTAFDRLLQSEEPVLEMRQQQRQRPPAQQARNLPLASAGVFGCGSAGASGSSSRSGGAAGSKGGGGSGGSGSGGGDGSGGCSSGGGPNSIRIPAVVKMEVDDEEGEAATPLELARRAEPNEFDRTQWLNEPDAPLALPLRPFPDGYRGTNGAVSRGGSRAASRAAGSRAPSRAAHAASLPNSRPASRVAFARGDEDNAQSRYPAGTAAAALYRGLAAATAEAAGARAADGASGSSAALAAEPAPLLLFQLPPTLPLKDQVKDGLVRTDMANATAVRRTRLPSGTPRARLPVVCCDRLIRIPFIQYP